MSRWFRHYAGMMRDEKLVSVAIQSKQSVERVLWVWGAILESAAEINDNGKFSLDTAEAAYFLRADQPDLDAIINSLATMGRISEGRVAKWGRRQFASDQSAERTRVHRQRTKGKDNANVTETVSDVAATSLQRHCDAPETETYTEAEKKKESSSVAIATRRLDDWPTDYQIAFWKAYPRKVGKQGALRELERVRKRAIPWEKLMSAVIAYAATADPQFTKHPQTWLSKGCWDDDIGAIKPHENNSVLAAADRLIERVRGFDEPAPTEGVVRIGAGAAAVRAIPPGGRERPGDLCCDGRGDPGGLSTGNDPVCDGPEDGDRGKSFVGPGNGPRLVWDA